MLTTYAVSLFAATWSTARARYLNTVVSAIAFAWELVLLGEMIWINL